MIPGMNDRSPGAGPRSGSSSRFCCSRIFIARPDSIPINLGMSKESGRTAASQKSRDLFRIKLD
jgi:hypothetical protein